MAAVDWRARLAHGLTALAASRVRGRYGGAVPTERLASPREHRAHTPAGPLHTLSWGPQEARPTVLLHGLNANARYWTGTACMLADSRRVLAPDLRGHGHTGPLPGGYALPSIRNDLLAWLETLGLERVDLVGHSMGGKVAADLAAAQPHRIRRLVLVDPVPPEGLHGLLHRVAPLRQAVFAPERGPFASPEELAAAHRTISWLRHAEPWMHEAFDANFFTSKAGVIEPVCDDDTFDELYREVLLRPSPLALDRIDMPVLLARATFSVMPFSGQVARLRQRLPRLEHLRIPGEHSLHATNPVGLARVIAAFLDR